MNLPTIFASDENQNVRDVFDQETMASSLMVSRESKFENQVFQGIQIEVGDDAFPIINLYGGGVVDDQTSYEKTHPFGQSIVENVSFSWPPHTTFGYGNDCYSQDLHEQVAERLSSTGVASLSPVRCELLHGAFWLKPGVTRSRRIPRTDLGTLTSGPPRLPEIVDSEGVWATCPGFTVIGWNDLNSLYTLVSRKDRLSPKAPVSGEIADDDKQDPAAAIGNYYRFTNRLWAAFESEVFEDGIGHPAERIIGEALHSMDTRLVHKWLREVALDVERPSFASSVLRCLGRDANIGTSAWRVDLVEEALTAQDIEIRDAAVQVAESWGDHQMVAVLRRHDDTELWLNQYIQEVIQDLGE